MAFLVFRNCALLQESVTSSRGLETVQDNHKILAVMSAVNLSAVADQGLTHWDIGLSKTTACVIRAQSNLYNDGPLCDLLHALREMRRYITRSASRREASPTLESALTTVLSPLLQEFYAQENSYDLLEELLEIMVALGQGSGVIIEMMGSEGIFHVLTTVLMYTPTTEIAAACLGRLAGTSDLAAREAQIAILASGMALTCPPIAASAPESSAMAAVQAQQACALPVVYKLLTAQDKGAQKVAIEMLTFLCEMGSEWQTQEQLTLASFDNGVILAKLVERIEGLSSQTRLSTAMAAELATLLELLSSATSGCEVAQSKVEEHHILQHLVRLLLPSNQRIQLVVTPSHGARVVAQNEPHFKVSRRQMVEVLIAMTNVVSQHAANQALLVSLAEPLTEALAAWLSSPCIIHEATYAPACALSSLPSCAATSAQLEMAALKKNSSSGAEPNSTAPHTAAHESSRNAQKPATTSALTSQLKGPKQPSLLTAQLKDSTPTKAETLDPSASATPSAPPQGAALTQRGESSKKSSEGQVEDGEVQLARRFVYHLLLHLPVEVLRNRQAFWMEHAVGLPELMLCCLGVAVMQEPTAVKSLCQMLQQWVHQPGGRSVEALQWLSNFPAVVQGLVQTVSGEAASEAIQILSLMSQQGGGVGSLLGAAGAAEAIVAAALARSDIDAFKTTKEVSDLVVRVLPDSQAAVSIIHECQSAILTATSTAIRHRAISLMRAMTNLLRATPSSQHDADKEELLSSQPAVPAVSPAAVEPSATDTTAGASSSNLNAESSSDDMGEGPSRNSPEGCPDDSAGTPLSAQSASFRSQPASQPRSMEQTFALEMLSRQCGALSAAQPKAQRAVAGADTEVGSDLEQEEEKEALAAARRQQLVDDAMDKLFEDMTDELSSLGRAPWDSDIPQTDTVDSGVWVSASEASKSSAASVEEEQEGMSPQTYSCLEEKDHKKQREEQEFAEEEEEEEGEAELQALAFLETQGYTGLRRGFLQPPQAESHPTPSPPAGPDTSRGKNYTTPKQRLTGFKVNLLPAQGTATESTPSKTTPGPTAPTATSAAAAAAAASTPQAAQARPIAQIVTRPAQPSKGLPSLALSRTSRKAVKLTLEEEEETVLIPSQQGSGLTGPKAPHAREQDKQLSQAEMQRLMDFVFRRGFERVGELADQSLADQVDEPATATAAAPVLDEAESEETHDELATPTAARVLDEAVSEQTHAEMQDAFAKLVQDGKTRQRSQTRPELEGAALSQAVAGATTAPIKTRLTATSATAGSSGPASTTEAAAAVSSSRDHHSMDDVPKALIAKERVRVAQNHEEYELPRFHSVFCRYGSNRHVQEIQEMTDCQRQVGFAVEQKPFWQKHAFKALLAVPSVILASGIAKGVIPLHKKNRSG